MYAFGNTSIVVFLNIFKSLLFVVGSIVHYFDDNGNAMSHDMTHRASCAREHPCITLNKMCVLECQFGPVHGAGVCAGGDPGVGLPGLGPDAGGGGGGHPAALHPLHQAQLLQP